MISQYKQTIEELNNFIEKHQPFLTKLLEELQIVELEEKHNEIINNRYSHELLKELSIESDLIKEKEFKLGFTIKEINFTSKMIDGRRRYVDYITAKQQNNNKEPINKLEKMIQGLTKEDMIQLLKGLK